MVESDFSAMLDRKDVDIRTLIDECAAKRDKVTENLDAIRTRLQADLEEAQKPQDPLANVAYTHGAEAAFERLQRVVPRKYATVRLRDHWLAGYDAEIAFERAQMPLPLTG